MKTFERLSGAIIEGYHGDAAYTAGVGEISAEAARLLEVTEKSLFAGIEQLRKGNRLHEVGRAVQDVAEAIVFLVGARTIDRIQKIVTSELNKIAIIHLYLVGYRGEDRGNCELKLANSSSSAEQQVL